MNTYYAFTPELCNGVMIGTEKFEDIFAEVKASGAKHFNETETKYRKHDYNPNISAYIAQERAMRFVLFTARDVETKKLLGYLGFWIVDSVHMFKVFEAHQEFLYVDPAVRTKGLAAKLYEFAEPCLRLLNVSYIMADSKAPLGTPDLGPLLEKRGFLPVAVYYSKSLE